MISESDGDFYSFSSAGIVDGFGRRSYSPHCVLSHLSAVTMTSQGNPSIEYSR